MTFRLLLPFQSGAVCYSARLLVLNDADNSEKSYELFGTDEYEGDCRWWEVVYTAEEPGLYWYCFEYDGPWSTEKIYRGPYSNGCIASAEARWQMTVYESRYRNPASFKGGVMYQIFPDRFYNSGTPKERVPTDRDIVPWDSEPRWRPDSQGVVRNNDYFGGDLKGIEEKIPYIKNLGVTILYINPIFESHTNHRYSTADYSKIDPLLGTEQDFISLCATAHRNGMKVILDGVFNHTGSDSIYFNKTGRYDVVGAYNSKNSPYYGWFNFINWPNEYESWWGFDTLPEVNENNEDYIEYITGPNGIVAKWLKLGADGWRLDVADELPDSFIARIHERVRAVKPDGIVIGEVWEDASNKVAYSQRKRYLLGNELDSVMDYPFANAIIGFVGYNDADNFLERILSITENYPKQVVDSLMNMLGTHDTARVITRLAGEDCGIHDREWQSQHFLSDEQYKFGVKLEKMAAAIQYTLPGFPSIYYGDEAGMQGYKDPFNRRGFTWDSINTSLSSWYSWLGLLRKTCPVLERGQFIPISGGQGCVCYARANTEFPALEGHEDVLVVIANRNPHPITYTLPEGLDDLIPIINTMGVEGRNVKVDSFTCALLGRGTWAG